MPHNFLASKPYCRSDLSSLLVIKAGKILLENYK